MRPMMWLAAITLAGCANEPVATPDRSGRRPAADEARTGWRQDPDGPVFVVRGTLRRHDGVLRQLEAIASDPQCMPGRGGTSGEVRDERGAPRSRFGWGLPHRQLVRAAALVEDVPALGTLYLVETGAFDVYFGLTRADALVPVRSVGHFHGEPARAVAAAPFLTRYGRQAPEELADVGWVRAALASDDPVLRLQVLDLLGGELVPLDEARRTSRFTGDDERWCRAHAEVRADEEVRRLVRQAQADPIEWIAEAARRAAEPR